MTITAQRILTELGNRAWSGFNADDMQWDNVDSQQAKTELNFALRYLTNLQDFPFKAKEKTLSATANKSTYSIPDGQITNIYDADNFTSLTFIGSGENQDKTLTGQPTSYWIDYNNPTAKLRLYPIPDKQYNLKIVYNQFKPVLTTDNETSFEFTNANDFLNMPELLEYLFMDCLVLRVMVTNNKDQEDENYQPMINEFNEAWKVFKKACKPVRTESRCIW